MNVRGISEHQNKASDTDRYKGYFFTARVSQVDVKAMKTLFEQRSVLQVAKCLIVHVLSSSNFVFSLEIRNKKKATQEWNFRIANHIVLNQVPVYLERVFADNVVSNFQLVRLFSSQHHSKFNTNITSESASQVCTKESKTRSFFCKVNVIVWALWDTLAMIQLSLWLCFSWLRVLIASSTISVMKE